MQDMCQTVFRSEYHGPKPTETAAAVEWRPCRGDDLWRSLIVNTSPCALLYRMCCSGCPAKKLGPASVRRKPRERLPGGATPAAAPAAAAAVAWHASRRVMASLPALLPAPGLPGSSGSTSSTSCIPVGGSRLVSHTSARCAELACTEPNPIKTGSAAAPPHRGCVLQPCQPPLACRHVAVR